jgi:hypothetical protein
LKLISSVELLYQANHHASLSKSFTLAEETTSLAKAFLAATQNPFPSHRGIPDNCCLLKGVINKYKQGPVFSP